MAWVAPRQPAQSSRGILPGNEPTKVYNVPSPLGTPGRPKPVDSRAFAGLAGALTRWLARWRVRGSDGGFGSNPYSFPGETD